MEMKSPLFWNQKSGMSTLLSPLCLVYQLGLKLDRKRKEQDFYTPSVPVISIGNLTVGGTGKTPVVGYIAYELAKAGEKVAILSRGFGGSATEPHKVNHNDDASVVGDEPKMLHSDLYDYGVTVWVCPDRVASAMKAEAEGATIILLDDGMQTWRLHRDMDICVVDSMRGFGNLKTLPAGPLREPLKNLSRANIIVCMNGKAPKEVKDSGVTYSEITPTAPRQDTAPLHNRNVIAFCGIGNPEKFFRMLENSGIELLDTRAFGDHHPFTEEELEKLKTDSFNAKAKLVTTPKDFYRLPVRFRKRCHVVRPIFNPSDAANLLNAVHEQLKTTRMERTDRRRNSRKAK